MPRVGRVNRAVIIQTAVAYCNCLYMYVVSSGVTGLRMALVGGVPLCVDIGDRGGTRFARNEFVRVIKDCVWKLKSSWVEPAQIAQPANCFTLHCIADGVRCATTVPV